MSFSIFESLPVQINSRNQFRISSGFGQRRLDGEEQFHQAVDIAVPSGTPVLAVAAGRVIRTTTAATNTVCGNGIIIAHQTDAQNPNKDTYTTTYCHFRTAPVVQEGQRVTAAQVVGEVGQTGSARGPHLHFVLREVVRQADAVFSGGDDIRIDPTGYLYGLLNRELGTQTQTLPSTTATTGITPFISSLESFHPKIQYELTRRSVSSETANAYMPYVKLTSLTRIQTEDLPDGTAAAWCPSLGIHAEPIRTFEDIYTPQKNRSTIGYAITGNGNAKTRVIVRETNATQTDSQNIPIPGIIKMTTERGTAGPMGVRGGLFRADISILAYSVGQVDGLLRYFLRPATRVVLELGRKSSSVQERNLPFVPYNWNQREDIIATEFSDLIDDAQKQQEFINRYIYDNYGNYEIFIGYVVKFNLKYNKDNTYVIDLTIHSVQQFELPTKHTGVKSICAGAANTCKVMDVHEYFSDTYSWKDNTFSKLIDFFLQSGKSTDVIRISQEEPPTSDSQQKGPSTQAGTRENEYFVTWNFFVQEILNNSTYGIASVLGDGEQSRNLLKLALPQPTKISVSGTTEGLNANEVGYHPNLRSTSPGIMIINNPVAQRAYENSFDSQIYNSAVKIIQQDNQQTEGATQQQNTNIFTRISSGPKFQNYRESKDSNKPGAGWLQEGIWLNTAAIKRAFTGTDTVTSALSMLLNMMNTATEGYWNLQLYSTDTNNPGIHVIDMGLSKPPKNLSTNSAPPANIQILNSTADIVESNYNGDDKNTPKYIYQFNKKTTRFTDDDIGSELLDMNIEFNLPQVIAVQAIAGVGGPAQKSLLQSIDIDELNRISLIQKLFNTCENTGGICTENNTSCYNSDIQSDIEIEINQLKQERQRLIGLSRSIPAGSGGGAGSANAFFESIQSINEQIAFKETIIANQIINQNPNVVGALREYADLGTAIALTELNPSNMMRKLNLDSLDDRRTALGTTQTHAFNSSNLTKTVVDVTLPGIGGINLFQSFLVGRAPSILDKGFYVVTKINHEFSPQSGWITKIQGRFRFKPVGDELKDTPREPCASDEIASTVPTPPARTTTPTTAINFRQPNQPFFPQTPIATPPAQATQPTQVDAYLAGIRTAGNKVLLVRLDLLEKSTKEPTLGTMSARETWQRRLNSGEVARDRTRLEAVKTELRNRIAVYTRRNELPPKELQYLTRRLQPKQY
jgi:hypothetical protein